MRSVTPDMVKKTAYEVITTKFDKQGNKEMEKVEKYRETPKLFKDLNNSMKMLETIKKDGANDYFPESTQALLRNQQKKINGKTIDVESTKSGAGYLSQMMNP